jgi:hypothetical protein
MSKDIQEDLDHILETGITHTATVMVLLKERGWGNDDILPVIYQALLQDRVDPKGVKTPYKGN